MGKHFLSVFDAESAIPDIPPIWLMRQAGRYLAEYRKTRETAGGFLDLCYNPTLASEVTLQPIRKFGFDASILFADILLLPHALGQDVWFETGEGPRLSPVFNADRLNPAAMDEHLAPVYKTVATLSQNLPNETTLIGFAGAPWTVATYMIAGRGTPDQAPAHDLIKNDVAAMQSIIDILVQTTTNYLAQQVAHGAECLQIFDSWAGSLKGQDFETYCLEPNRRIVASLREMGITVPVIGFPRGAGDGYIEFAAYTGVQAVSFDQFVDLGAMAAQIPEKIVVQGNLDPQALVRGGDTLDAAIDKILHEMQGRRHIFNLGHGIVPQTPPENVARLVHRVRQENS